MSELKVFVAVATVGRADLTRRTVDRLVEQTRPADGVVVVGASPADIEGVEQARGAPEVLLAEKGLCRQRNRALDAILGRADIVVFLDDDYVAAPDFIEQVTKIFRDRPNVVGVTGHLIADGIHNQGFQFDEAVALIAADADAEPYELTREALYGCNMCIRLSAAEGLRFDDVLPLYGWQEDIDFTYQLGQRGDMVKSSLVRGVHMGTKGGRTAGNRIGYSQIANPVYLLRKRTMPPHLGWRLMRQNLLSNTVRSLAPEAHIDRRGRLAGNLAALRDLVTGRLDPRRILEMG